MPEPQFEVFPAQVRNECCHAMGHGHARYLDHARPVRCISLVRTVTQNLLHAACPFRVLHPDVTVVQPGQDWDSDNGTAPLHPGVCAGGTSISSRGLTCAGDVGGGVMLQWNIRIATFFIVSAAIATTA